MFLKLTGFVWILIAGAAYGFIHSGLAANWTKNLASRWFGENGRKFYRLFFVGVASLTTLVFIALVVTLPDELIYLVHAPWLYLTLALQAAAVIGVLICLSQISTASFLGLTALPWFQDAKPEGQPPVLVTNGLYRWVRHPIYTCSFLFLIFMPWMSWNVLAFTICVVAYTIIGAFLEEKKMVLEFGQAYLEYQKRTPMFLPFRLK